MSSSSDGRLAVLDAVAFIEKNERPATRSVQSLRSPIIFEQTRGTFYFVRCVLCSVDNEHIDRTVAVLSSFDITGLLFLRNNRAKSDRSNPFLIMPGFDSPVLRWFQAPNDTHPA